MKSQVYYTTRKESSKVFKRLGNLVGIKALHRSQRGIIARKALHILENYELEQFSNSMPKFEMPKLLKINQGGRSYFI